MSDYSRNFIEELEAQQLKDPRIARTRLFTLAEVVLTTFVGILASGKSWNEISAYGNQRLKLMRRYLPFKNGVPSHDTLNRFFQRILPSELEKMFKAFVLFATKGEIDAETVQICIDGKTCCGSSKAGNSTIHMVSAWCASTEQVLAQIRVAEKTNEITTAPLLLEMLDLDGAIVTGDSMYTQVGIVELVNKKKGTFVFQVKGNQPTLEDTIKDVASNYQPDDTNMHVDKHGGVTTERLCETFRVTKRRAPCTERWKCVNTFIKVTAISTNSKTGVQTEDIRYYMSNAKMSAEAFQQIIIKHWSIERKLHWHLDVTYGEDDSRKYAGHSAENFSRMLRLVMNYSKKVEVGERYRKESLKIRQSEISNNIECLAQIFGPPRYPGPDSLFD